MSRLAYFFICIVVLCSNSIYAQNSRGNIKIETVFLSQVPLQGNLVFKGIRYSNGEQKHVYAMEGALVVLTSEKGDTLKYGTTERDGFCLLKNVEYGKYNVTISHMGYKPFKTPVSHNLKETGMYSVLEEQGFLLEEVKVKGNIPLVMVKGDTLVVNPKAVETQQGAAAIEIIKQVPGIEITSGGAIMAFGKVLQRTYVGGTTLFGTNVFSALKNLDAELVKSIKVYDEDELVSVVNGIRETRKVRVLNIETTRQLLSSTTGHLLAGIGKDMKQESSDDAKIRYKGGGSFNMFTNRTKVQGNFVINNVGLRDGLGNDISSFISTPQKQERTLSAARLNITLNKKGNSNLYKGGKFTMLNYTYNKEKSLTEKFIERLYFPNDEYTFREYSKESTNDDYRKGHMLNITHINSFVNRKIANYQSNTILSFNNGTSGLMDLQQDSSNISSIKMNSMNSANTKAWNLSEQFTLMTKGGNSFGVNANYGDSDGAELQMVESSGTESVYETSPEGKNVKIGVNASVRLFKKISNKNELQERRMFQVQLQLNSSYTKERKERFRYDVTLSSNPILDSVQSYSYSTNNFANRVGVSFDLSKNGKYIHTIKFGISNTTVKDNNRLWNDLVNKNYLAPYGTINLQWQPYVICNYDYTTDIPALEELRRYINDNNPLFVQAGNSNLRPVRNHRLKVTIRTKNIFESPRSLLEINIDGNLKQNDIVPYSVYYPKGGTLEEYGNYNILPSATFSTYKNASNSIRGNINAKYSFRISPIKTKIDVSAEAGYMKRPSFVQDKLNVTDTKSASVRINTNTSYKWATLVVRGTAEYTDSDNTIRDDYKYLNRSLKATLKLTLLKVVYLNGSYLYRHDAPVGGSDGYENKNNILNASAGLKLFKGRLNAGISVFDIFNKSTDFSTMQYSDYVQNTWTPTFGRYFSFDVTFNLRSYKFK